MNVHQIQIYNHLLKHIVSGKLTRNERIPTEKKLSLMFNTNRMNAHFAVKELECSGILHRNKRQGTFVQKIPSKIAITKLKCINTRRVCVLNHTNPQTSNIHWNERIISVFENKIVTNKIEMAFKDISFLNSRQEFCDFIEKIAKEGYNSLIMVEDSFTNAMLRHPEMFFQFHNNVFIFNRGTNHWHDWLYNYNIVSVNLFREGVIAAEYLFQNGYEKIVYNKGDLNCYWVAERARGLEFGLLRESDGKIKADIFEFPEMQEEKILDEIKNSNKKCAIVAQNDEIASCIFKKATKQNLKPGIDFGLLGFDNNAIFREFNLTTVSPPLEKIGLKLAELVIDNLDGQRTGEISTVYIDSELIVRKTC